jgi:hypothetical protein
MMLNLIYHFQTSQNDNGEFIPASYGVVYFFSEEGFLEKDFLKEMAKVVPEGDHSRLTFINLDDSKTFATRVSQELNAQEVRLISVQDYNIGLDGARDMKGFKSIFSQYGEGIANESAPRKKTSLLSKLFN